MDLAWYAAWKALARHIPGTKQTHIIHTLLARGAASPRAKSLQITPAEADRLKKALGHVPKLLGDVPLLVVPKLR